jgi:hypothetical protein
VVLVLHFCRAKMNTEQCKNIVKYASRIYLHIFLESRFSISHFAKQNEISETLGCQIWI